MKHILIIDDDIYIGNVIEEALIKEGYQVLRAYSGTEAIYVLSASTPDLILLDLMLPGLSGEEVLSRIKGIPVIVVSAKIDVDDKVALLLDAGTGLLKFKGAFCLRKKRRVSCLSLQGLEILLKNTKKLVIMWDLTSLICCQKNII